MKKKSGFLIDRASSTLYILAKRKMGAAPALVKGSMVPQAAELVYFSAPPCFGVPAVGVSPAAGVSRGAGPPSPPPPAAAAASAAAPTPVMPKRCLREM